jgi:SAM-dependent methyltransferase
VTPTNALHTAASNTEQLRAWDGEEGAYWATHADHFDRSAIPYHRRLLASAAVADGDRVLDIGCGTGQTTVLAARAATSGSVLGVDLSSQLLAYAQRRAYDEGIDNASFEQADAQIHPFDTAAFDVAISNTGATFFGDLVAGFNNVGRAVRPGGRLVLLTWQSPPNNEWIREFTSALAAGRDVPAPRSDAPSPFALADPDRVRDILTSAGFIDIDLEAAREGMWFGNDPDDAHQFVLGLLGWMLEDLDDDERARAVDALHATMAAHETADGVNFDSAIWLIRATRQ